MLKAFLHWLDRKQAKKAEDAARQHARAALIERRKRETAELAADLQQRAIEAARAQRANAMRAMEDDPELVERARFDQHRRDIADMAAMRAGQCTAQTSWPASHLQTVQQAALQEQENQWAAQRIAQVLDVGSAPAPACDDSRPADTSTSTSSDCGSAAASE